MKFVSFIIINVKEYLLKSYKNCLAAWRIHYQLSLCDHLNILDFLLKSKLPDDFLFYDSTLDHYYNINEVLEQVKYYDQLKVYLYDLDTTSYEAFSTFIDWVFWSFGLIPHPIEYDITTRIVYNLFNTYLFDSYDEGILSDHILESIFFKFFSNSFIREKSKKYIDSENLPLFEKTLKRYT